MNDHTLTNVAAVNNSHLNITALNIHGFEASSWVYTTEKM